MKKKTRESFSTENTMMKGKKEQKKSGLQVVTQSEPVEQVTRKYKGVVVDH
jgi:hypothetical protein